LKVSPVFYLSTMEYGAETSIIGAIEDNGHGRRGVTTPRSESISSNLSPSGVFMKKF
jgi:hypothetical protein